MSIVQGLASDNANSLYAAWKGESGDDRLFCATFNGTAWDGQPTIPGNSSFGPSLAFWNGQLYAAWKGEHEDNRLFYAVLDGTSWKTQQIIPGDSDIGPSLATFNGSLYAAWKGAVDLRLYFAVLTELDGTFYWSSLGQMIHAGDFGDDVFTSCVGPSLAVFNGALYAVWRGDGNQGIYYASYDGSVWSAPTQLPGTAQSTTGASIAQFGSNLYMIWKGVDADERLFLGWLDAQLTWHAYGPITQITCSSSVGAALSTFGNKLYAIWKGPNSDQQIFCGSFDGSNWTAEPNVPGNTGPDMATMPYAGLRTASNYIMTTSGVPITSLTVKIEVTAEIASDIGYAFQLNCYTTQGQESAWQQYILCYPLQQATQIGAQVNNWTTTAELLNSAIPYFCFLEGPTPAGTVFDITLSFDPATQKVIGANFTATLPGKPLASHSFTLSALKTDAGPDETLAQMSPIVAFQLNFVGPTDGETCVLSSGAGTISYTASPALTASAVFPSFIEYDEPTGEAANSAYGLLPIGSNTVFSQAFAAVPGVSASPS